MIARALIAAVVAIVGLGVFDGLSRILVGLIGSSYEFVLCAVGSFVSTFMFARPQEPAVDRNLLPAALITFMTFAFIAIGHAIDQLLERRVAVDFEPIGLFIWATVATNWWLVPGAAVVLSLCNRIVSSLGLVPRRSEGAV